MTTSPDTDSAIDAIKQLSAIFNRNGYVRRQSRKRLKKEGHARYKKGDEIRFIAVSRSEVASIFLLLRRAGFEPGRPFVKGRKFALPVYGRTAVQQLLALFDEHH